MKILKQVLREFGIQFILSIVWAIYAFDNSSDNQNLILNFIKNFGACFFLTSWFAGQLLRIIKQQKLESNLNSIITRIEKASTDIQEVYRDIRGYTVGGDSFCYLDANRIEDKYVCGVIAEGKYPMYDITMSLRDLNNKDHDDVLKRPNYKLGDIAPGIVKFMDKLEFNDTEDNYIKYDIHFYTRKGHFRQQLRMIKFEGEWYTATRVLENEAEIFRKLYDKYPIAEPFA